ncbi:hypothetical protein EIN_487490 [Entamoeba invadens IP1]|uniref:Metallo-beta-lactamase domain-containing protein n=1 Tax=Entamoeba invadens IP1 TaxID=370355 RepID=A0A0A1U4S0_ENTIV|nr:hypothetical protein EIN_487490 [Entamoeba invadens IP1]ELP89257.1 hypothetical protein EIN_487490 [Entamoeba invadens IP1]|eukprot:XP_004256028.1 hypothetical protein EIN_487490 [Entamoeba invadens IP1]
MATEFTKATNKKFLQEYDITVEDDYKDTFEGYYADLKGNKITKSKEELMKDFKTVAQINSECPETMNPSMWKHTFLDDLEGVFEIVPNEIYQVRARSLDFANLTVVRGQSGWIVIDCMTTNYASRTSFNLIRQTVEDMKASAIIITHSHGDHYLGFGGVGNEDIPLYLPDKFDEMIYDERVTAGDIMSRRAKYMYGCYDQHAITHCTTNVTCAEGEHLTSIPYSKHTTYIKENITLNVDGVDVEFINTPDTEAPANMMCYFPKLHALAAADNMLQFLHNLLTFRGAKVRSGKVWSKVIDDTIVKYGTDVQVHFGGHDWHILGNAKINKYWEVQRDMFKYQHDQALRYANKGYSPNEIAEIVELPKSLSKYHCCRGLYGNVGFNVKSQFQMYLGWYDNNPAHLNELPPKEIAIKYVEGFGGEEKTLEIGKRAYDKGEYRWAATVLNHLVFANYKNKEAKEMLAKTYDQLQYQSECASFAYNYQAAAYELRHEDAKRSYPRGVSLHDLPLSALMEFLTVCVDPKILGEMNSSFEIKLEDTCESVVLVVSNGVVHTRKLSEFKNGVKGNKDDVCDLFEKKISIEDALKKGVEIKGMEDVEILINAVEFKVNEFLLCDPNKL